MPRSAHHEPKKQLERVDAVLEQALDLSPANRTELIESLVSFDMVMSERPALEHID